MNFKNALVGLAFSVPSALTGCYGDIIETDRLKNENDKLRGKLEEKISEVEALKAQNREDMSKCATDIDSLKRLTDILASQRDRTTSLLVSCTSQTETKK